MARNRFRGLNLSPVGTRLLRNVVGSSEGDYAGGGENAGGSENDWLVFPVFLSSEEACLFFEWIGNFELSSGCVF